MYVAHKSDDGENRLQSVKEHLNGVASLAEEFAAAFGSAEYGKCCGKLHDIGKYSDAFQKRILNDGPKKDHSTAGAKAIMQAMPSGPFAMMAYCIMGHHSGLPDGGTGKDSVQETTFYARLKREVPDFSSYHEEVDIHAELPKGIPPIHMMGKMGFSASFFTRMLYSCLVDADFLDTEKFMQNSAVRRGQGASIAELNDILKEHLRKFDHPETSINQERCGILNTCMQNGKSGPKGLYTLTVPTGGGKTLSSLAFALNHAAELHMKRVIYVIPYTSIIEQNAEVFRKIFGDENVLEHHSNFTYDDSGEQMDPRRLAAENWDAPLIVTTNVQFFESFFSNRSSRCRKLHNVANSVIIFDEAQMIPRDFLQPCVRAIAELTQNYGCTAVLCSATQPALEEQFPPEVSCNEICKNSSALYEFFKRTSIQSEGVKDDETLAAELNAQKQVLCIVNTRRHAQNLFSLLEEEGSFHLSTLMYPAHRKRVLETIRERLRHGEVCRVVSTSLIEAGVDVDFPVVYRAEFGLDSEIQAAGRCNREGKRPLEQSPVIVFQPEEKYRKNLPAPVQLLIDITKMTEQKYEDVSSPEAIRYYFETLYRVSGKQLDKENIVEQMEKGALGNFSFPFATVAGKFKLIDRPTKTILIPKEPPAAELLNQLRYGERTQKLMRAVGSYCVSVYDYQEKALFGAGQLEKLDEELSVLLDLDGYSEQTGLITAPETGKAWIV